METASTSNAPPAFGSGHCDGFASHALALIPAIISRQDRDPHSPTYGCFDPDFWHRRALDFPAGSAAEAVLPLALAFSTVAPGNLMYGRPALKEWIEAGIRYAARSAHADGSCDEHFPFERQASAVASSLLACLDAYSLLGLNDAEMLQFFTHRADWLAGHRRQARDSTPLALTVLALEKAGRLLGTERWEQAKADRLEQLLRLQDEEGWFPERNGADPGCQSFVLGLLAQLHQLAPSHDLRVALAKGIGFAAEFVHPDGSFGDEYGSVGARSLFPHGFEIAGGWFPEALSINDQFLRHLSQPPGTHDADRRLLTRRCWSFLLASRNWNATRPPPPPRPAGRRYFKNAGILIDRRDGCELYVALNKGGVFTLWRDGAPVATDTHFSVQIRKGRGFLTAVANPIGHHRIHLDGHTISITGKLAIADQRRTTTLGLVARRVFIATVGRIFPGLARARCRAHLDAAQRRAPFRFTRTLAWSNGRLQITDILHSKRGWAGVHSVGIGSFQSGRCAHTARAFHAAQLRPWQDFTVQMHENKLDEPLKIERLL